jgi:hypothetical protein
VPHQRDQRRQGSEAQDPQGSQSGQHGIPQLGLDTAEKSELPRGAVPTLRTRLGAPKAITAMARKPACLFYRLIKHGQQYVDKGIEYYEARYREQQIRSLAKKAQKLGLQVVMPTAA